MKQGSINQKTSLEELARINRSNKKSNEANKTKTN